MAYHREDGYERVRREQAQEGKRMTRDNPTRPTIKPKKPATGHEAFLKALEESGKTQGTQIQVEKLNGEKVVGIVRCSDHFTITLRVAAPDSPLRDGVPMEFIDRVIFKHDISEFRALQGKKRDAAE